MLFDGYWVIIFCVIDVTRSAELKSNAECAPRCTCESFRRINCSGAILSDLSFESIPHQVLELDLSNNDLRSVPQPLQVRYTDVVSLNLSSNRIAFIARNTFGHMAKLKTLDLSHNLVKSLSDIEAGILFAANTKLQALNLSGNAITDLGDGYDQILYSESLLHLDVSACAIAHLQGPIVLQGLPKLIRLDLSKNTITRIDGLASNSLQMLDLSECNLHFLRYDSFEKLTNLKEVTVSGNRHLTDQYLRPASASVVRVDASYCSVHTNYASDLVQSQTIQLRGNLLTQLAAHSFENNSKLEYLDLSDNRIRHIHELAFVGATSLRFIDLSTNRIATLEANTFSHSTLLHDLYMAGNLFATIPAINSSSLLGLDLSSCHIEYLANDILALLPSLRTLNVSHNRLVHLATSRLISSTMQTLDISYCRLTTIDVAALRKLTHLREIDLRGNRLIYLRPETLTDKGLERVALGENPWICDCQDPGFRDLWLYLAAEPTKLKSGGLPRCQHPENVTDRSWHDACYQQWNGELRKSKDVVVLAIIVTVLLVSGIVACIVAVKESWKVRRSRHSTEEDERERLHEPNEGASSEGTTPSDERAASESIRKLTQLPSYDEALLLPKPTPSADDEPAPTANIRQTVIRLEMSKKRQSATQTEETIDALLQEIAQQQAEETPDSARRESIREMQYVNVKPLPVQCTEL